MNPGIEKLSFLLLSSPFAVFFGGAGVSTESGIPDFRSPTGLYAAKNVYGRSPEELLSRGVFEREPELFFRYYKENLISPGAKPNPAHLALAALERAGKLEAVVTQNIDGLHQAAGSVRVLELHGSNLRHYCVECGARYTLGYILAPENCGGPGARAFSGGDSARPKDNGVSRRSVSGGLCRLVPRCEKCGGIVRPDVVLYGENLDGDVLSRAAEAISRARLLIVGGTSLAVYPAAGLLEYFRGDALVIINKSPTPYDGKADLVIREPIGETLSKATEAGVPRGAERGDYS
ncbi:MAG: NAD-dependent deacylase [Firmicutes bacterium]|nr:NAD-dependent deacylase [Bacillota bacterium]